MTYHARTRQLMTLPCVGLAPREAGALQAPRIHPLPSNPGGMGVVGGVGVGKTWALAQHAADHIESFVCQTPDPDTAILPRFYMTWVNWPERAEEIKRLCTKRGTELEDWIERVKESQRLYMDDLGRERMAVKGEDDYAQAVLGEVLDHRYRYGLPVFWSSNLTNRVEFAETYNARLVSRLLGSWPPFLIKGHDIRMDAPANISDFRRAAGGDL